jgi:hypothetical protein
MKAIPAAINRNGTLSISDLINRRFSTKRSSASNTAGNVATESFPAAAKKKSSNDKIYQRRLALSLWR